MIPVEGMSYKEIVETFNRLFGGEGTTGGTDNLFNARVPRAGESAGSYLQALKTLALREGDTQ